MTISLFDQNTIILLFVAFAGMIIWRYLGVLYSKNIDNESYKLKKIIEISTSQNIPIEYIDKKDWAFHSRHSVVAECDELKTYDESNIQELNINKLISKSIHFIF